MFPRGPENTATWSHVLYGVEVPEIDKLYDDSQDSCLLWIMSWCHLSACKWHQ